MNGMLLRVVLALVLAGPVVSGFAVPEAGRASEPVGRSETSAVVARRQRLAELDVSAAAVKLLAGNVVAGSATVGNVGSARARSSMADVAWKSTGTGGLVQVGRFQIPALKPGQRHKAQFEFDVRKSAPGSYEVSVCADVLGQVQEHNKKTNCRDAGTITIPDTGVKGSWPTGAEPASPAGAPPAGSSTPPASTPPDTVIDSGPVGSIGQSSVTFTFHGSDTTDTFQCSLDGAPWAACSSPQQYSSLAEGGHSFEVRAINAAGEVDPTPASASFTVEATAPQTTITSVPSGRIPIGEVSISFASSEPGSSFECSLDGAAYSPCSSPDVVKDPAAGPHTFKVQATNQAGVKETTGPPSASWSSVEPQHDLCGTISSNTTIGPDYAARYIISCSTTVASGATLTAQPGTIIKAEQGTRVSVEGSLDAMGTEAEPVTFTSINDNSVGGNTGSGSPAAADWGGIDSSGGSAALDLQHVALRYAVAAVRSEGGGAGGATTLVDDAISGSEQGVVADEGSGPLSVTGSTISVQSQPVYASNTDSAVTVTKNTITATAGAGGVEVYDEFFTLIQPVAVTDNTLTVANPSFPAIAIMSSDLNFPELATNTLLGPEASRRISVGGTVASSQTWAPGPFSWSIERMPIDVPAGVTLTIAPGTVVKSSFIGEDEALGRGVERNPEASISVEGALDAIGTPSEPITFTSLNDNSVGGATGTGSPGAGEWSGLLDDGPAAVLALRHVAIDNVATAVLSEGGGATGLTTLEGDAIHTAADGVMAQEGSGPVSVTQSAISSRGEPVYTSDTDSSVTVTGNTLTSEDGTGGLTVFSEYSTIVPLAAVGHNTVTVADPGHPGIEVMSSDLNFAELATNTISGPESARRIDVGGTVATSQTWSPGPFPWSIELLAVNVLAGVTLTVAPGTTVKSSLHDCGELLWVVCGGYDGAISVQGTLEALGTAAKPVTFTSTGEDAAGEWLGIEASPSSQENPTIKLEHTAVSYAATGLNVRTNEHVTVQSDIFAHNTTALNISATLGTNAAIHGTWFDENGVALDGSSDWNPGDASPFFPCQYIPSMSATNNTYGPEQVSTPFISPSDDDDLLAALVVSEGEESPDGWTEDIAVGTSDATTTDTITWDDLPCTDGTLEGTTLEPATPFAIGE